MNASFISAVQSTIMASSSSRVLRYTRRRNSMSSKAIGRKAIRASGTAPLASRREDALERDAEVEGQVGLQVVVRLVAAGGSKGLAGHLHDRRAGRWLVHRTATERPSEEEC